ncbi:MBL fold metallo-hydrolase [Bacillus sp. Marseille-P3661]|uniref:MBL fold metallo-hydrolase n=1 Tax=Bacillus sp. Marseille-P3661 TaxID=1936234 RepID=UPI0015E19DDF|nr:MBL fold metallo-hydrolase [Bacillus sp. Marseille-P3661]
MTKLSITMLGTGSPRPELRRSGPAQTLSIDDETILIDCGEGTTNQLLKAGLPPESIKQLWFTHLHSDHTFGYGQFLIGGWGRGRSELTIIGPKGTKRFHEKILDLYEEDINYRCSLGRSDAGIRDVRIIEIDKPCKVENPSLIDTTVESMIHNVPTFGYRLEINNKIIVISGDTAPHDGIINLAKDADVLVIDAGLATGKKSPALEKIWDHLQKEHCTAEQVGQIAAKANVKKVVLTHFLPELDPAKAYDEVATHFSGEIIIPEDLDKIEL